MKIVIAGEAFEYDGAKQPVHEALWIEHVYKRRYGEWQDDLQSGSAKALIMLACLIWRRDGRDADAAWRDILAGDLDFDLNEMLASMQEAAEAAAKAADAEAAAEGAANPTPARSAPAGTGTTAASTSASSRSTSTSPPGKSGSSKSRTSSRLSITSRNTSCLTNDLARRARSPAGPGTRSAAPGPPCTSGDLRRLLLGEPWRPRSPSIL